MTAFVSLALVLQGAHAQDAPARALRLADLLAEVSQEVGQKYVAAGALAEARVIVTGKWEPPRLVDAVEVACRAEWREVNGAYRLTRDDELAANDRRTADETRKRVVEAALATIAKSISPYQASDEKLVAQHYVEAVEDYVRKSKEGRIPVGPNFSTPTVEDHPMRTLAVELLLELGASELAGIPIGDSVTYSTLSLPGVKDLKNSGPHAKAFERVSIAVADRLAASAQSGELAGVNGMNWLFGSTASWLPVTGLSLTVKPWGDELWASVVIDRGLPQPDGFMERVPLGHGSSDLAHVLLPSPLDQIEVHWRPETITRYPVLSTEESDTKGDLAKISIPEALGTSDIVSALSIVRDEPVLALLPVGFEAQISSRLKAKMTSYDALDLLGKGYFGLGQAKTEGGLVLRPRNGTLGPWDAGSARASRRFVSNARERHAYGADDLGRYFAGVGLSTLGTAEANWWETCLVREGLAARSRVAMPHDYRLLGQLLRIAPGGGKWKYAVLPKDVQESVRTFAFGGILNREGEISSLLTLAESSRIKWETLTVHLAKQTVPAARLKTSVASVLSAATLADYLDQWQPGYPEILNPSKLRLVEGVMEVFQVRLVLSEKAFIGTEFPSTFTPTGEEVEGISALSDRLRAEIEKCRTPPVPPSRMSVAGATVRIGSQPSP